MTDSIPVKLEDNINTNTNNNTNNDQEHHDQQHHKDTLPLKQEQTIVFDSENEEWTTTVEGRNVDIKSYEPKGDNTSWSKVRMKSRNLVNYNWELKLIYGNPLAVHHNQNFYAYSVLDPATFGAKGMVRVGHKSSMKRLLLREMYGLIHDLAFAHINDDIILGCIDATGSLHVHAIEIINNELQNTLLTQIELNDKPGTLHRIIWCPFIPDEDDIDGDSDYSKLVVTTHGNKVCIWNIRTLIKKYGKGYHLTDSSKDCITIDEHTQPIVDASISPDGNTLATASEDGYVLVFQIYLCTDLPPKRIFSWKPHDGLALSSLFFLDKINSTSDRQFWKYAITGSLNNSVMKLWCCETWTCIQTFNFDTFTKPALDKAASHLILSDIYRKTLYILHFQNDFTHSSLYCNNVTFLHVPYAILCLGITDTNIRPANCPETCVDLYHPNKCLSPSDSPIDDEANDDDEENFFGLPESESTVVDNACNIRTSIKMYLMQPKSLQEATISYVQTKSQYLPILKAISVSPSVTKADDNKNVKNLLETIVGNHSSLDNLNGLSKNNDEECEQYNNNSILAQQSQKLKNLLLRPQPQSSNSTMDNSSSPLADTSILPPIPGSLVPLNLMTPEAFSSSKCSDDTPLVHSPELCILRQTTDLPIIPIPINLENHSLINNIKSPGSAHGLAPSASHSKRTEDKLASGGSSPSREVQEILSLKGSDCFYEDDIDDEINSQSSNHIDNLNSPAVNDAQIIINDKKDFQLWLNNIKEANQNKSNSEKSTSNNRISNLSAEDNNMKQNINNDNVWSGMEMLDSKLDKMIAHCVEQQKEISALKQEVLMTRNVLSSNLCKSNLSNEDVLHGLLQKNKTELKQIIESTLAFKKEEERKSQEVMVFALSEMIDSQFKARLSEAVSHEFRNTLVNCMESIMEPLKSRLITEVSLKVASIDTSLNQNMQKLFNSKTFMNKISMVVSTAVTTSAKEAFKQIVQSDFVPNMEKAQAQMFKQLNTTFNLGTKEYISFFENCTKQSLQKIGMVEDAHLQLKTLTVQLQHILDQQNKQLVLNSQSNQTMKQLNTLTKELHNIIPKSVQGALEQQMSPLREVIREQISSGMAANAEALGDSFLLAMRSQTQTPAPMDTQTIRSQIDHHIALGEINAAFQKALSASDLKLLAYTMSCVDIHQVFCVPCPLQQNVLLSLIQQLGADMEGNLALKHKYLKKAVMNLDSTNPVTKEHMPNILRSLQVQLSSFVECHPTNEINSNLMMLNLAIDGMLKRIQ